MPDLSFSSDSLATPLPGAGSHPELHHALVCERVPQVSPACTDDAAEAHVSGSELLKFLEVAVRKKDPA